jgi:hypothetical protein
MESLCTKRRVVVYALTAICSLKAQPHLQNTSILAHSQKVPDPISQFLVPLLQANPVQAAKSMHTTKSKSKAVVVVVVVVVEARETAVMVVVLVVVMMILKMRPTYIMLMVIQTHPHLH